MTLVIILSLLSLLVVLLSIDIASSGAFRVVSAGWMIMSFIGGQVVGFSQWMALFSWSADYHPLARSTIGIILVFSLVPAITLALAIGALASDR